MIKLKGSEEDTHGQKTLKKAMGMAAPDMASAAGMRPSRKDWTQPKAAENRGPAPSIRSKTHNRNDDAEGSDKEEDGEDDGEGSDLSDFEDFADSAFEAIRAKRLHELKSQGQRTQQFLAMGHGSYREIVQDEFLPEVTQSKYVVCHFYHDDFERCKVVDMHMLRIAPKHLATKFVKINAEKTPFFVQKLAIKMLPTIVCFKDGIAKDRVVGFEELGGKDDFSTDVLEKRLGKCGVLVSKEDDDEVEARNQSGNNLIRKSEKARSGDSDDDSD